MCSEPGVPQVDACPGMAILRHVQRAWCAASRGVLVHGDAQTVAPRARSEPEAWRVDGYLEGVFDLALTLGPGARAASRRRCPSARLRTRSPA